MTMLKSFLRDENGATAIEYGLIAAGISVAIITGGPGPRLQPEHDLRQREERAELRLPAIAYAGSRAHRGLELFRCAHGTAEREPSPGAR